MEHVSVVEELEAPIDRVWVRIRDFGDVSAWAPQAVLEGIQGEGAGAVRRIETEMGLFVERCPEHDDAAHRFSYEILESPLPFTKYLAVVELTALSAERCQIEWSCEFEADPSSAAGLKQAVENTYREGFIAALRETLAKESAP